MFGRLAMGFANVRAVTRVPSQAPLYVQQPADAGSVNSLLQLSASTESGARARFMSCDMDGQYAAWANCQEGPTPLCHARACHAPRRRWPCTVLFFRRKKHGVG